MKYCSNCGNQMDDDMLFCQKCGTQFKGKVANSNDNKILKIKEYNLVIPKENYSWQYINDNFEKFMKIVDKQNSLCDEFKKLLTSLLYEDDKLSMDDEKNIYIYTLKMLIQMCNESSKMFSDYSGLQEVFDTNRSILNAGEFLNFIINIDFNYKLAAGFQMQLLSDIKEILDEELIKSDKELRNYTFLLAEAFNDMWYNRINRFIDFFTSPSEGDINMHWNFYNICLKGLYQFEIDKLDEKGWDIALDDQVKNHHRYNYKNDFNENRENLKQERIKKDLEDKKKFYFEKHPEQYDYYEKNSSKLDILTETEIKCNNKINELNNNIAVINRDIKELNLKIDERNSKLLNMKKSIFGEKATQNKKDNLNKEISSYNDKVMKLEKEAFELEQNKENAIKELEKIKAEKGKIEMEFQKINFEEVL